MSDKPPANAGSKQRPGRFQKGRSGNPTGRKPGIRNRATVLLEAIADDDLKAILAKIVEKAKGGDLAAAKLIFDRVAPEPKGRAFAIDFKAIGPWNGTDSVLHAHRVIVEAVTDGQVSAVEGLELVALVEAQRATVKELRPEAMYSEPTPKEREEQKQRAEEWAKLGELLRHGV